MQVATCKSLEKVKEAVNGVTIDYIYAGQTLIHGMHKNLRIKI